MGEGLSGITQEMAMSKPPAKPVEAPAAPKPELKLTEAPKSPGTIAMENAAKRSGLSLEDSNDPEARRRWEEGMLGKLEEKYKALGTEGKEIFKRYALERNWQTELAEAKRALAEAQAKGLKITGEEDRVRYCEANYFRVAGQLSDDALLAGNKWDSQAESDGHTIFEESRWINRERYTPAFMKQAFERIKAIDGQV